MSETVIHAPPRVEWPPPPRDKGERECRAFLRLLPGLLQTHRGQYVAIHNEQVVDSGDDERALASRVWGKFGYVPIHIGLVTDQPAPPARVPTFRVLSPESGS